VCMSCHGLGFSIDALADPELINKNFNGKPAKHVESIDMAVAKDLEARRKREEEKRQRAAREKAAESEKQNVEEGDAEETVAEEYEEDFDEYN